MNQLTKRDDFMAAFYELRSDDRFVNDRERYAAIENEHIVMHGEPRYNDFESFKSQKYKYDHATRFIEF